MRVFERREGAASATAAWRAGRAACRGSRSDSRPSRASGHAGSADSFPGAANRRPNRRESARQAHRFLVDCHGCHLGVAVDLRAQARVELAAKPPGPTGPATRLAAASELAALGRSRATHSPEAAVSAATMAIAPP